MTETFAALLLAHVLADFILQTRWMIEHKRRPTVLLTHTAVVLLTAQITLGHLATSDLLALAAAHLIIDATKTNGRFTGLAAFLTDQVTHLATLAVVAAYAPHLWADGIWHSQTWLPGAMVVVAGLILATRAGSFAVAHLMAPYQNDSLPKGLLHGGSLIGILERGLIFLLVLVDNPQGSAF